MGDRKTGRIFRRVALLLKAEDDLNCQIVDFLGGGSGFVNLVYYCSRHWPIALEMRPLYVRLVVG